MGERGPFGALSFFIIGYYHASRDVISLWLIVVAWTLWTLSDRIPD